MYHIALVGYRYPDGETVFSYVNMYKNLDSETLFEFMNGVTMARQKTNLDTINVSLSIKNTLTQKESSLIIYRTKLSHNSFYDIVKGFFGECIISLQSERQSEGV